MGCIQSKRAREQCQVEMYLEQRQKQRQMRMDQMANPQAIEPNLPPEEGKNVAQKRFKSLRAQRKADLAAQKREHEELYEAHQEAKKQEEIRRMLRVTSTAGDKEKVTAQKRREIVQAKMDADLAAQKREYETFQEARKQEEIHQMVTAAAIPLWVNC